MRQMANPYNKILSSLGSLAAIKNPKSYSEWLATTATTGKNKKRSTEAAAERRSAYGYGSSIEGLAQSSLINDGYAAYLRNAAKAQRTARHNAAESEHTRNEKETLAGYADYLRQMRDEDEQELKKAAESVLSLDVESDGLVDSIGESIQATSAQKEALKTLYTNNIRSYDSPSKRTELTNRLIDGHYSYQDAYRYCRSLGLSPEAAKDIASAVNQVYDKNTQKMHALVGKSSDQ